MREQPSAAGPLQHLRPQIQGRTAPPGARDALPRGSLHTSSQSLSRPVGADLPLPRQGGARNPLRAHLHAPQEGQHLNHDGGQTLGIKEVDDGTWPFNFMHFNLEQKTLQTAGAPNRNSSARVGPSAASHGYSCGNVTGWPCGATAASIGAHTIRIENSQGTPDLLARVSRTDSLLHAGKNVQTREDLDSYARIEEARANANDRLSGCDARLSPIR